ncbi:hypothetical protein D3C72_1658760 [compost metagenome]
MAHALGFFEQGKIGKGAPQRTTGTIAQQEAGAGVRGIEVRPKVKAGIEVGVGHGVCVPGASVDRRDFSMPPGCHQCW